MKVGYKIRKLRELKGFSQEYMALQLGMSQNNYSKIELGKISPNLERIDAIAQIIGIDPVKIIEFDENTIFNNHNQEGGNSANYIIQEYSEKMEKVYLEQIQQLKEQVALLKMLIDKK